MSYKMEKFAAFGAECGRGVFTPGSGTPPGPKNMLGRKRNPTRSSLRYAAAESTELAIIESSHGYVKRVSRQVPVATKEAAGTFPEIGNDHDLGLVISGAGFDPCLPFAHVVGRSKVGVPIAAADLQTTELVDSKEVNHAGDRVRSIHSRGAILQDVDVINHRKGNQVNVHASAEPDGVQRTKGDTFSVNEHQGFFGQQAAQVELNGAVPASGERSGSSVPPASCGRNVVRSVALRMPSFSMSAGRCVSTGFGPTSSAVGNVRASDNDAFHFGRRARRHLGRRRRLLPPPAQSLERESRETINRLTPIAAAKAV